MKNKNLVVSVLALVAVAFAGISLNFYFQLEKLKQDPQKAAQEEIRALVTRVSRLIVLPEGEDPTVATVSDPAKLKDQAFFANAQMGDKVLIYTSTRKAILYNPTTDKIVEVAPVNIGNPTPAPVKTVR